ncbi:MAG: ABC transporter permease [Anaerolineales bacterium]|nr:ABC transporter permease [Anaerolineales bacterium]
MNSKAPNQMEHLPRKLESIQQSETRVQSPSQKAWIRLKRHHLALVSGLIILLWIFIALSAPIVAPCDPYKTDVKAMRQSPSATHLLGTDMVGRDVLSRLIFGSRTSLQVVLGAVSLYVLIGIVLGSLAGYFGGTVDSIITRLIDIILCFPMVLIILTFVSIVGPSLRNVVLILGLLQWPSVARYVRAEFLTLRERDYVIAAQGIGVRPASIMFKHILPNALSPVIVIATFGVATSIVTEASLSFLGWGVPLPTASWGNMLTDAQVITVLQSMPWLWLPPGLAIGISMLAINFFGDGLRDALDPQMQID